MPSNLANRLPRINLAKVSGVPVIRTAQTHSLRARFFAKWEVEKDMSSRRLIELCVLLGLLAVGWFAVKKYSSRQQVAEAPKVIIQKQPVAFATHTFDPAAPPADMLAWPHRKTQSAIPVSAPAPSSAENPERQTPLTPP